jgi:acyl carrier protein phosphodiesterase
MNFLAHAYLSGDDPKIMTGNFIADFVKGRQALKSFSPEITRGIELHRLIDEFTDTHEVVSQSKNRLRPKYRHYSAVIVDVFYDHFLAKNWKQYHAQPLADFAAHVYKTIDEHHAILPEGVTYMLPYMKRGNWLVNYSRLEGIERALTGMAGRTPYLSKMEEAVDDLKKDYSDFEREFETFFPSLKAVCATFLSSN